MSHALCGDCRKNLVTVARAAICVLADQRSNDAERRVAADVVTETVEALRLPTDIRSREAQ